MAQGRIVFLVRCGRGLRPAVAVLHLILAILMLLVLAAPAPATAGPARQCKKLCRDNAAQCKSTATDCRKLLARWSWDSRRSVPRSC